MPRDKYYEDLAQHVLFNIAHMSRRRTELGIIKDYEILF